MERAAILDHARQSMKRGSKSFFAASRLFDRQTRERVWLLYGWCRACDDIADGQDHGGAMGSIVDPLARLEEIRQRTARALYGGERDDPAFAGLALLMAEVPLPQALIEDVIAGFALDAQGWRPRTSDDLLRYCYHVAGAVGCMMAMVMGVPGDDHGTLARACDLGIAFQLANIARDIAEDAAAGRCYLPEDWLGEMGVDPAALMAPASREGLARLTARLASLAARHEESARAGAAVLPFRSAWAVLAAAHIYGGIARKVQRAGEAALNRRISTSRTEKAWGIALGGAQALVRRSGDAAAPRDPALWQRPILG